MRLSLGQKLGGEDCVTANHDSRTTTDFSSTALNNFSLLR